MRKPLSKFVKGSIAKDYFRQIAERNIEATRKDVITKQTRKTLSKTIAQKGGGWTSVDQIRKSLTVVEETARVFRRLPRRSERANRAEEIQREKVNKVVKATIKRMDRELWKFRHDNWDWFLLVGSERRRDRYSNEM